MVQAAPTAGPSPRLLDTDTGKQVLQAERTFSKPYKYLINPENVCPDGVPVDLFVVFSTAGYSKARSVIRRTWGRDVRTSSGHRLIFIFGKPITTQLQNDIAFESLQLGDITQGDFKDSYRNLTLKTIMMLRWAMLHCPQARFVVKIDDDSFPNLGSFYRAMHGQAEETIYGQVMHGYVAEHSPDHRWYIPYEQFSGDVIPDFIVGGIYVIGGRVVELLYRARGQVKPFRLEDMYPTRMCTGVSRTRLDGMQYQKLPSLCEYQKAVYGHHVTAEEMNDLWYAMKQLVYKFQRLLFGMHICYCHTAQPLARL
ncbi:beta-1,3-galactosyltransferase 1-like [Amblyomma americanum]